MWTGTDPVFGRMPLSRWREEYKEEAKEFMQNVKLE